MQDTADKLAQLRKVIATLDIPVRQVMIESRLVIANDDFAKEIGIQFGYSKNTTGNPSYTLFPALLICTRMRQGRAASPRLQCL